MFNYYLSCYYYKKEYALDIVNKIYKLIEMNPYIKNIYNQKKDFYDIQFSFAKQI